MDSLSALTLRSSLLQIILASRPNITVPRNLVYDYPTIARLAEYISPEPTKIEKRGPDSRAMKMDRLVKMFTLDISKAVATAKGSATAPVDGQTVLLTGSTGTFGSQILATLLQHPHILKVVCLNRDHPSLDIFHRHRLQMDDPGLLDRYRDKLVFAAMETSQVDLGLNKDVLELVRVSLIICDTKLNPPSPRSVPL